MRKPRVFLGNCSAYHAEDIKDVIREGLSQLALTKPISGRITIKPNLVMAHPKVATDGYTRAEVIGGILANLNLKKSSEKCVKIVIFSFLHYIMRLKNEIRNKPTNL